MPFVTYENFGVRVPKGYEVHGIDVSHHQGHINWEQTKKMRSKGDSLTFTFIKATEGRRMKDILFKYNWRQAHKEGFVCGAYHYYRPHVPSKYQAELFIRTVTLVAGDLPPVLDIEEESIYGSDNMRQGIINWLRIVEEHYKVKPIIYTSASFYERHLDRDDFKPYVVWIAHYRNGKPRIHGERWHFWQYSDGGTVDGCKKKVDMNVFRGNLEELRRIGLTE